MLSYQNLIIIASALFYLLTKIISILKSNLKYVDMHNKRMNSLLTIPETLENDMISKWVPKKRHEVLKAKYKCLKKLFQIYDANIMGVLPEQYSEKEDSESNGSMLRKKRSFRNKTDASAGTDSSSIDTAFKKASSINNAEDSETISSNKSYIVLAKDELTQTESELEIESSHIESVPKYYSEKPKLTRFQYLMKRLFGVKYCRKQVALPSGHVYATSEYNIGHSNVRRRRRRRRGLRLRKWPKMVASEGMLEPKSEILSHVHNVQKNCLKDMTPRQCPIKGCSMMFYGIINYNDHLNFCHFPARKFNCHYCHEGFQNEKDKLLHENEHLGIPKLNLTSPLALSNTSRNSNDNQTEPKEVPRDKLKKIVSFYDKIVQNEHSYSDYKNCTFSESHIPSHRSCQSESNISSDDTNEKKTNPCQSTANCRRPMEKCLESELGSSGPIKCPICSEHFEHRRELSLHVDLEHRAHKKYSKFNSCAGLSDRKIDCITTDGTLNVQSMSGSNTTLCRDEICTTLQEGSQKNSTNVVHNADSEMMSRNNSTLSNIVQKVKSGIKCYKWEPGTKIIHV